MNLTIEGKGNMSFDELNEAIPIMFRLMKASRIHKNMNIHIHFKSINGLFGQCLQEDTHSYEITISKKLSRLKTLLTLAHELVHVKQFFRKELNYGLTYAKFKGVYYNLDKVNYYDLPHEVEAHGREEGLVLRYLQESILFKNKEKLVRRTI